MKKTQILKELNEKESQALNKELLELTQKMAKLKMDAAMKKLKNIKSIQETRKRVARIWTILNKRAIEQVEKQEKIEVAK